MSATTAFYVQPSAADGRITTPASLVEHLQWALELEHFTVPPFLCALYSLDPDRNPEAMQLVASVVVEEMLHMTLVANLMNAVGGRPRLDSPTMLRGYPRRLPHSYGAFDVSLRRFSPEAVETILKIERPATPSGPPEGDHYESIGQFYDAIKLGLKELCEEVGESIIFCGDPARQVEDSGFYSGGGRIVAVDGIDTALAAIAEIVTQGEGAQLGVWDGDFDIFHPEREQVAHYFRFQELVLGRRYRRDDTPESGPTGEAIIVDWGGVYPMRSNPRTTDNAPGSAIRTAQEQFNHAYCGILRSLQQVFNGRPELLGPSIGAMYDLKEQARALMQIPSEDGVTTAGPSFEYVEEDGAPN
jgi:hypothetical protein